MKKWFYDSYALVEMVKGNPKFIPYLDSQVIISSFNLIELTYSVLQDNGEEKAREIYRRFKDCVIEFDENIVLKALMFKKLHPKSNFSYADCIGYFCAKYNDLLFLTGDEQFRNLPGVEFIKK